MARKGKRPPKRGSNSKAKGSSTKRKRGSSSKAKGSGNAAPGSDLNPKQRRFAEMYFGDAVMAGNATACYRTVYRCKAESTATTGGSKLTKNPKVQRYLAHLQQQATAALLDGGASWADMVPRAQAVIMQVLNDPAAPRGMRLRAAEYVVDRALGKPRMALDLGGSINVSAMLLELAADEEDDAAAAQAQARAQAHVVQAQGQAAPPVPPKQRRRGKAKRESKPTTKTQRLLAESERLLNG